MSLPNDVCRCVGLGCATRYTCQRFVDRVTGEAWTPFANLHSDHEEQCAFYIPQE